MSNKQGIGPVAIVLILAVLIGGGLSAYRNYRSPTTGNNISIIAPKKGEKIAYGEPYVLRWQGGEDKTVCLSFYPHPEGKIAFQECVNNTGSYTFDTKELGEPSPELIKKDEFSFGIIEKGSTGKDYREDKRVEVLFELVPSNPTSRAESGEWTIERRYTNPVLTYEVGRPFDWGSAELQFPCTKPDESAFPFISQSRSNLPGYAGVSVAYLLQFCVSDNEPKWTVAYQGFILAPLSRMPVENDKVSVDKKILENTEEHAIAKNIISSMRAIIVSNAPFGQ